MSVLASVFRRTCRSLFRGLVPGRFQSAERHTRGSADDWSKHPFDLEYGTDTGGFISGPELATGHEHDAYNTAYYAMSRSRFEGAMELWRSLPPKRPVESYAFVDLGCGKGRAILMASELPFREVVGVELHPALARTAEKNARKWRRARRNRTDLRVVHGDATEVELPDLPILLYLFHPFETPVLERLLRALETSFGEGTGLLDIVYFNPDGADVFARHQGFELLWQGTIAMGAEDAATDHLAGPEDLCHLYRWMGK